MSNEQVKITELSESDCAGNKDKIKKLLLSTSRPGMENLVEWIEKETDFFTAPASTKYHLACRGGLAQHSLNVYELLLGKVNSGLLEIRSDTIIITALLHDLCKVNFYCMEKKNVREGSKINAYGNEVANWVEKEVWTVRDSFPVGHGRGQEPDAQGHSRGRGLPRTVARHRLRPLHQPGHPQGHGSAPQAEGLHHLVGTHDELKGQLNELVGEVQKVNGSVYRVEGSVGQLGAAMPLRMPWLMQGA